MSVFGYTILLCVIARKEWLNGYRGQEAINLRYISKYGYHFKHDLLAVF